MLEGCRVRLLEENGRCPFGCGQVEVLAEAQTEVAELAFAHHTAARARVDRRLVQADYQTVGARREEVFRHFVREWQR